jgi:hypothetical protein
MNVRAAKLDSTGRYRRTVKTNLRDSCKPRLVVMRRRSVPLPAVQSAAQRSVDGHTPILNWLPLRASASAQPRCCPRIPRLTFLAKCGNVPQDTVHPPQASYFIGHGTTGS